MTCPVCQRENPTDARFCGGCGALLPDESVKGDDPGGLIGQVVGGRYRIKRLVGEGGMGVVYEAEQPMGEANRRVAIKTLLPELSQDHSIVSRFHRESSTIAQLDHPNTIRLYDFGQAADGRMYLAMEFVEGRSLTDVLEEGPLPLPRVKHILRQVAGALEEAHQKGIVHRDLKPDNIILTERGGEEDFVKVLDFGIAAHTGESARAMTKLTQQGTVLGTPPYMSPEQLAGEPVDARSDVYSLGIIAYEMLTGRLPFEADTPWQWASKHMTEAPPPPSTLMDGLPPEVERAVLHALEKRREDRPPSALAFFRELIGETALPRRASGTEPGRPRTQPGGALLQARRSGTEQAPVVVPAYRTESAVAANIPPPPATEERPSRLGLGFAIFGGLLGAGLAAGALYLRTPSPVIPDLPTPVAAVGSTPVVISPELDGAVIAPEQPANEPPETPVTKPPVTKPPVTKPPVTKPPVTEPPVTLPPVTQPTTPPPTTQPTTPPTLPTAPTPQPTTRPTSGRLPRTPAPDRGPSGDAACQQSENLARAGAIESAVSLYNRCAATGGSGSALANAKARIRSLAPEQVKKRGFLGNCAGAISAANAASSIGAGGPAQAALGETSCK